MKCITHVHGHTLRVCSFGIFISTNCMHVLIKRFLNGNCDDRLNPFPPPPTFECAHTYMCTCLHTVVHRSHDHAPEDVEPACRLTLKNLQLEYLDLYLIHNPFTFKKAAEKEWADENKLGYDQERLSHTWQVCCILCFILSYMYVCHVCRPWKVWWGRVLSKPLESPTSASPRLRTF